MSDSDFTPVNVRRHGSPDPELWPSEWKQKPDRLPSLRLDASNPRDSRALAWLASRGNDGVDLSAHEVREVFGE